ncbi:MAG: PIN domain-containing protein, partial [Longimicrobiales bacterium]
MRRFARLDGADAVRHEGCGGLERDRLGDAVAPHAPPAQVIRLLLQGEVVPLHDARILAEYRDVLWRPKFDFDPEDIRAVLSGIDRTGETVFARPLSLTLPDPDDL